MRIQLEETELTPIIERVVEATIQKIGDQQQRLEDRLAFREPEAAQLMGINRHVLRDARLRGELKGSRVGRIIIYSRDELLKFMARQEQH